MMTAKGVVLGLVAGVVVGFIVPAVVFNVSLLAGVPPPVAGMFAIAASGGLSLGLGLALIDNWRAKAGS